MIFVSAGHHKAKPGASFEAFNEFEEAIKWQAVICEQLGDSASVVPAGVLKDKVAFINSNNPSKSVAIEIHFNSAKTNVAKEGEPENLQHIGTGCETLYYPGSKNGEILAGMVHKALTPFFKDRGIREGYYRMQKKFGPDFFLTKTICPATIIEPDFIHHRDLIQKHRVECCQDLAMCLLEAQEEIYHV